MLNHIASQIGQTEDDGGTVSSAVRAYLEAAGISSHRAENWNAALLAWCAIKSGLVPPVNAAEPLSWLSWGAALSGPAPGSVVVLTDGSGRTAFLCGIAARVQSRKVYVIGSFDRVVQTRCFPIEQVIGARRPPGASAIQSFPIVIEHEPQAVPSTAVQTIQQQPIQTTEPATEGGVSVAHLEALLSLVQDKFAAVDSRIDAVQKHAIAAVNIQEITQ